MIDQVRQFPGPDTRMTFIIGEIIKHKVLK